MRIKKTYTCEKCNITDSYYKKYNYNLHDFYCYYVSGKINHINKKRKQYDYIFKVIEEFLTKYNYEKCYSINITLLNRCDKIQYIKILFHDEDNNKNVDIRDYLFKEHCIKIFGHNVITDRSNKYIREIEIIY
jgi:hypothetical protein